MNANSNARLYLLGALMFCIGLAASFLQYTYDSRPSCEESQNSDTASKLRLQLPQRGSKSCIQATEKRESSKESSTTNSAKEASDAQPPAIPPPIAASAKTDAAEPLLTNLPIVGTEKRYSTEQLVVTTAPAATTPGPAPPAATTQPPGWKILSPEAGTTPPETTATSQLHLVDTSASHGSVNAEKLDTSSLPFLCRPLERPHFIINVPGDAGRKRREHATWQMKKAGIDNVVFWPAADSSDTSKTSPCVKERSKYGGNGCVGNPHLANTLTHRQIMEHIVREQLPCATIYEDDFALADNFKERFDRATRNLPPFDEIQLGYCPGGGKPQGPPKDQHSMPIIKYGWPGPCAHAYIISLQGAWYFSTNHRPVRKPADGIWDPRAMKGFPNDRSTLDQKPGALPGAYWYLHPMLSWQEACLDRPKMTAVCENQHPKGFMSEVTPELVATPSHWFFGTPTIQAGSDGSPQAFLCRPLEQPHFIINVPGESGRKRREHATWQMKKAGISNFVFWPAVDAADKSDSSPCAQEQKIYGGGGCVNDPHLANTLTHRQIMEHVVQTKLPCATIYEDDFTLANNFKERFGKTTRNLPPFDEIQLGYCPSGGKPQSPPTDQSTAPIIKYGWPGPCAHAYIISLQGAWFFSTNHRPVRKPADGVWDPRAMKGYPNDRSTLDHKPGALPGSYWYLHPMLSWQEVCLDRPEHPNCQTEHPNGFMKDAGQG
eukprot:TRINITY_DN4513_c0_g1_i1.p1 TRINITY_DN4513_c0_g1~~TRINITY_DN4513_c0_g1_i1.p1  ORF type:complete len:717 (+),score=109.10 TRINITY_DN4513_c0_g1_i1:79-2229(+)